jgi:putative membrane protein
MKPTTMLLVGAALICLVPASRIELTPAAQAASVVSSKQFVETAGVAGMFEIESSRIAVAKSKNADVKAFAERMISDHTKAAAQLESVAKSEKLSVPAKLDMKHQKMVDELKAASEPKFDALYVKMQTAAHKEAVALFGAFGKQGDNAALRTFAAKTLPVLQEHYDMVKKITVKQS